LRSGHLGKKPKMIQTKPQKSIALPPADSLGARFCQYFSHPYHFLEAPVPALGKKPDWRTETRYALQPRNLWQEYQNPNTLIGLRFGDTTRYCVIDIDSGSSYHPANDVTQFKSVLGALETIGLCRPLLVRSSDSEGIHVYYFLPEPAPTFNLACAVRLALEDAGLYLRPGQLEIFPNTKAYSKAAPSDYNGHRLPLQAGSYWLDDDAQPLTNDLARFLDAADTAAACQDSVTLLQAIAAASKNRRRLTFVPGSSEKAAVWKRHLEERIAEGWTGRGQTNELLKDFATYGIVWLALAGDALINFVVETAKTAPGYRQHCGHQHEIRQRATERARNAEKWYSPYRSFPKRDGRSYRENFESPQNNIVSFENSSNVKSREQAADRIRQAITHLEATDTLPHGATARAAAIIATVKELTGTGISLATLHRPYHLPLWHPAQQKSLEPAQEALLHPVSQVLEISRAEKSLEPAQEALLHPVSQVLEISRVEKSLEPTQGALLHPTPLYEGIGAGEGLPEPPSRGGGRQPLTPPLEQQGESEGENAPSGSQPLQDVDWSARYVDLFGHLPQPESKSALKPKMPIVPGDLVTTRRIARIWTEANSHAQKTASASAKRDLRMFTREERLHVETVAFLRYLWDSGEPLLIAEVEAWAEAHPGILPEVERVEKSAATTDSTIAKQPHLKVGSRVQWDGCPAHCAWANPFTITAIECDAAWLDLYSAPVPLSHLRLLD